MIKSYSCPIHGEFDHEMNIGDEELKICGKHVLVAKGLVKRIPHNGINRLLCNEPVTRVFKPTNYTWKCDGFAGKGHS